MSLPMEPKSSRTSTNRTSSQLSRRSSGEVKNRQTEGSVRSLSQSINLEQDEHKEEKPDTADNEPEEKAEEIEHVYEPPPFNFIKVEFGDSQQILMNHKCIKKTFVDYINRKMGKSVPMDQLDLCDTRANLVGLQQLDSHTNVGYLFTASKIYIPCTVFSDENDQITGVEPCLNNWRRKYSALNGLESKNISKETEKDVSKKRTGSLIAVTSTTKSAGETKSAEKEMEKGIEKQKERGVEKKNDKMAKK